MLSNMDELDNAILSRIRENPGHSIADAIRPFRKYRSEFALRTRVNELELHDFIRSEPTKNRVLLYAVEDGDDVSE